MFKSKYWHTYLILKHAMGASEEKPITKDQLGAKCFLSGSYVGQLTAQLVRMKYLASRNGEGGGYWPRYDIKDVTVGALLGLLGETTVGNKLSINFLLTPVTDIFDD